MARDRTATALHQLWIAKANYDLAREAKTSSRELLNRAILRASEVGIAKAEIARSVGSSAQRVGQIINEMTDAQ